MRSRSPQAGHPPPPPPGLKAEQASGHDASFSFERYSQ
jgi:hypothetical protein